MVRNVNNTEKNFAQRMEKHQDELRWLYMELYGNDAMYAELCEQMHDYYSKRSTELKKRDIKKEKNPDWFKEKEMLGMMLYIDNFAGDLKGVERKLSYLKECNVNCIHLMPFLDTPKGKIRRRICRGRFSESKTGSRYNERSCQIDRKMS